MKGSRFSWLYGFLLSVPETVGRKGAGCLDPASPNEGHMLSKYHFLLSVLDHVSFLVIVQLLSLLH